MSRRNLLIVIAGVIFAVLFFLAVFKIQKGKDDASLANKQRSGSSISALLNEVREFEAENDILNVKKTYQRLISEFPNAKEIVNWQRKIEDINMRLLFSSTPTGESVLYEIKPGDNLTKIAKKFKTTVELIKKSNGMVDDTIFPGRKIKVRNAPFNILIDKSQNRLILKTGEEIIKTYIVSTGSNNSTPSGSFKITNKLVNPTWFKAGAVVPAGNPENILGSRWLGFDLAGYGIHGTTEPQNLGKQVTHGCVRMSNSEVEELYTIVPVGTEVTIVD